MIGSQSNLGSHSRSVKFKLLCHFFGRSFLCGDVISRAGPKCRLLRGPDTISRGSQILLQTSGPGPRKISTKFWPRRSNLDATTANKSRKFGKHCLRCLGNPAGPIFEGMQTRIRACCIAPGSASAGLKVPTSATIPSDLQLVASSQLQCRERCMR